MIKAMETTNCTVTNDLVKPLEPPSLILFFNTSTGLKPDKTNEGYSPAIIPVTRTNAVNIHINSGNCENENFNCLSAILLNIGNSVRVPINPIPAEKTARNKDSVRN